MDIIAYILCYVCSWKVNVKKRRNGNSFVVLHQLSISIFQTYGFSVECFASYKYNDKYRGSTYLIPLFKGTLSKRNKPEKKNNFTTDISLRFDAYFICTHSRHYTHHFSVCTYSKNFITGKEGDLPVGFPDRFNSSYFYYFLSFFLTCFQLQYLHCFWSNFFETWLVYSH